MLVRTREVFEGGRRHITLITTHSMLVSSASTVAARPCSDNDDDDDVVAREQRGVHKRIKSPLWGATKTFFFSSTAFALAAALSSARSRFNVAFAFFATDLAVEIASNGASVPRGKYTSVNAYLMVRVHCYY